MYHTTRDGKRMLISEMKDSHLINMVKLIERKADEGLPLVTGSLAWGWESFDVEMIYGQEVKDHLNYNMYVNELRRRNLNF